MLHLKLSAEAMEVLTNRRKNGERFMDSAGQTYTGRFPWPRHVPAIGRFRIRTDGVDFETATEEEVSAWLVAARLGLFEEDERD